MVWRILLPIQCLFLIQISTLVEEEMHPTPNSDIGFKTPEKRWVCAQKTRLIQENPKVETSFPLSVLPNQSSSEGQWVWTSGRCKCQRSVLSIAKWLRVRSLTWMTVKSKIWHFKSHWVYEECIKLIVCKRTNCLPETDTTICIASFKRRYCWICIWAKKFIPLKCRNQIRYSVLWDNPEAKGSLLLLWNTKRDRKLCLVWILVCYWGKAHSEIGFLLPGIQGWRCSG